jgi:glycogen operon protein
VRALRRRQQRNLLTTVFLSHGVPMLGHGDETGRTQGGNNNAYCQSNPVSWLDWDGADAELVEFVRQLARLRRDHVVLRRTRWAGGRAEPPTGAVDLSWYTPRGTPMTEGDWHDPCCRALVVVLDGRAAQPGAGRWDTPSLVVVINGGDEPLLCRLPAGAWPGVWQRVLDTDEPAGPGRSRRYLSGERVGVEARSVVVLAPAS